MSPAAAARPDLRHERFEAHYHGDVDFEREMLREEAEEALRRQDLEAAEASAPHRHDKETTTASRSWEAFHGDVHDSGGFFKDRRYLVREFYELKTGRRQEDTPLKALPAASMDVLEVGCGTGNSCVPVLGANPLARLCACDFSASAVAITASRAEKLLLEIDDGDGDKGTRRFHAVVGDPVTTDLVPASEAFQDPGCPGYGAAMLIFTLSAVAPEHQGLVMRRVAESLRPGGFVAFRDYGNWDMAMLRFPGTQRVSDRLYVRQDGTLAYFFELADLQALAEAAGLVVEELRWCRVANRNRRDGTQWRRIFVHATLRKPDGRSETPTDNDTLIMRQ